MFNALFRRGKPGGRFDPAAVNISSCFCIEIKEQQLPEVCNTLLHWKLVRGCDPTTVNVGPSLSIQIEGQQFPVQHSSRLGFRKLLPHRHPAQESIRCLELIRESCTPCSVGLLRSGPILHLTARFHPKRIISGFKDVGVVFVCVGNLFGQSLPILKFMMTVPAQGIHLSVILRKIPNVEQSGTRRRPFPCLVAADAVGMLQLRSH